MKVGDKWMNMPLLVQCPVLAHAQICREQLKKVVLWLVALICFICVVLYVHAMDMVSDSLPIEFSHIAIMLVTPFLIVLAFRSWQYLSSKGHLTAYEKTRSELETARSDSSVKRIQGVISGASVLGKTNHLIPRLLEYYQPMLSSRMTELHRQSLMIALENEHSTLEASCRKKISEISRHVPLIKTRIQIASSLAFLTKRRAEMTAQWEAAYEAFSWWNKLKYAGGPDFTEIDSAIKELVKLQRNLIDRHSDDFETLEQHFKQLEQQALSRISAIKVQTARYIQDCEYQDNVISGALKKSLWFSAMSVPVSMWSDLDGAANVYDTLRGVNGNFANMSDTEIWWESLFLPVESLAGLAALTKGAYFEHLVAADTGGQLFEHFNHPDTDILIDGVAFQLKATDSAGYVFSVDDDIPVIATSEVALVTGAIDGGYSNEELTDTVDNALGGTVIDIGDTTVDAILTGLGGLGFFATIEGINHASKEYENGGDAVEAIFEGAGVAIEGTARSLVGAAEMGYNILASRPSRFVGRTLLSGLKKLDDKLMASAEKK